MNWIILIIAVIVLVIIKNVIFDKIDEDEKKALATPGRADFIRAHFQEVIHFFESKPDYRILFERADMIRIGNDNEYYAICQHSGELLIVYVRHSSVIREWKFTRNELPKHIIYEIENN